MKFRFLMSTVLSAVATLVFAACASAPKAPAPAASQSVTAVATPPPAKVEEKKASADTMLTCTLASDKRVIEVAGDDAGCEVHYTKAGKTTTVASDKKGRGHCDKTLEKMKGKLEAAGYKCE